VEVDGDTRLTVTPPSWRFDITIEEDLIEEVARVIGFQKLPTTPPLASLRAHIGPERRRPAHAVRHRVAELGYVETINYSFVQARYETELAGNSQPIQVLNPIAAPMSVMRSSLLGSLVDVLRTNLARKVGRVRVFEVGRVFRRAPGALNGEVTVAGLEQPMRVAGLAYGSRDDVQWGVRDRPADFFDLKGDVEQLFAPAAVRFEPATGAFVHPALHPGRSAAVLLGDEVVGHVGELHPRWRQAYELPGPCLVFELALEAVMQRSLPVLAPVPRQHSVWRDVAVVVGESVTHAALMNAVHAAGARALQSAVLFDVFKPSQPGGGMAAEERSLAIRLELRDDAVTLTDAQIDAEVACIVQSLVQQTGARLRT
jgi:phenylalanyl-tRNA synthetase beta chain